MDRPLALVPLIAQIEQAYIITTNHAIIEIWNRSVEASFK